MSTVPLHPAAWIRTPEYESFGWHDERIGRCHEAMLEGRPAEAVDLLIDLLTEAEVRLAKVTAALHGDGRRSA